MSEVLAGVVGANAPSRVRLVRGSHVVVPKLFAHERAYIFQNADGRIVFAIPYEGDFTLIGTTDEDHRDGPDRVAATPDEVAYLCDAVSAYVSTPVTPADVVWSFSGVRPLYDDGAARAQEATRDYVLELDDAAPPLLSVFGGKITTYRTLAEAALAKLAGPLGISGAAWTRNAPLPGGDFAIGGAASLADELREGRPFITKTHAARLVRAYGTRAKDMLKDVRTEADLGRRFGADLFEVEAAYLIAYEWARSADDILWRRSKLGLRFSASEAAELDREITASVQAAG